MNKTRKLASLLLALVMVLGMVGSAMAQDVTTYSITINGKEGHTYEVYQIFTGDLYDGVLSNIKWGNGVSSEVQSTIGAADAKAETLTDENIRDFADALDDGLVNPTEMTATGATYTVSGLAAGYYLIKDKDGTQDGIDGAYTAYMLKVVKNVTATPKDSVPSVDKSVTEQGKNAEDVNIGDEVTFILKATLGNNISEFDTYKLVFHDTLSAGLTFKEYVSATLNNTTDVKANFVKGGEGTTLTFTCDNVKDIAGVGNGSEIVITYTATLNENATIGSAGNKNEVYLEYSNDPSHSGEGEDNPTGDTPKDEVLVFTYELDVTKVDGNDITKKLKDAEFVLYRTGENGTEYVVLDENAKVESWTSDKTAATVLKSDENGFFKIVGLDAGTYKLEETKAPAGYNLLKDPITVVITATLNTEEDVAALDKLTIKVDDEAAVDGDVTTGTVTMDIENKQGSTLPETGGIGTTLFYIAGTILVVGALVLMITKRRVTEK